MAKTKIEWTDESWNPVTGCTPVSEGCVNCWARRLAEGRLRGRFGYSQEKPFESKVHWQRIGALRCWVKPRLVGVALMGDLFHDAVPHLAIEKIWWAMSNAPWHTFQILTKRAERMPSFFPDNKDRCLIGPLPNVWLGVSVENQRCHDERVPSLVAIPDYLHWLSVEPLLEPIKLNLDNIDWVVVGCESGPGRRLCMPSWIGSVVDQCASARVPVFVKQLSWRGGVVSRTVKDWPLCLQVRQFPERNHGQAKS